MAIVVAGALMLIASVTAFAGAAGFFDRDPVHAFGVDGRLPPVAIAYFSGNMGLRFGMGKHVAPALAGRGIPVIGISSPAIFKRHHDQAEVNALVSEAIHATIRRTGARWIVLMGQSFGSDILASGLSALPEADRAHVAAIVLVVPGRWAYFRADPSGLAYRGRPDAKPAAAMRTLNWAPVVCIYGAAETDSLCPALLGTRAKVIELPGGHYLDQDHDMLVRTIMTALQGLTPAM